VVASENSQAQQQRNPIMPALNIPFGLSVLGAFLASTVVAYTYVWPALRSMPRYDALRLLAAFNAFRFFGMNFMVPGFVSPDLSASFASQIAWGDFIAAILALLSMAALSWRMAVAIPIVWIFNVWGALDLLNAYYVGVTQMGNPGLLAAGIYVPALYVPLLLVSHTLIFLLLARVRSAEPAARFGA
jgi:hypothetical protein